MIKAEKIADGLKKQIELLDLLKGRDISYYAIVIPPDGEEITMLSVESHADTRAFYEALSNRCKVALEKSGLGGVGMPRGVR